MLRNEVKKNQLNNLEEKFNRRLAREKESTQILCPRPPQDH